LQRFNALRLCIKIKKEKNQFLEVPFCQQIRRQQTGFACGTFSRSGGEWV
jgi:hypothetical protein